MGDIEGAYRATIYVIKSYVRGRVVVVEVGKVCSRGGRGGYRHYQDCEYYIYYREFRTTPTCTEL